MMLKDEIIQSAEHTKLCLLSNYPFRRIEDKTKSFHDNAILWYFKKANNSYLVISENRVKEKDNKRNFDFWRVEYSSGDKIGLNKPKAIEEIKLSFWLPEDLELLKTELHNC